MSTLTPQTLTLGDGRTVTLRHATPEDAAPLVAYVRAVLGESEHFLLTPAEFTFTVEQEAGWLRARVENPGAVTIIACAGDDVIGVLGVDRGGKRRTEHVLTFGISLRATWRGQGIGTAMLRMLLDWAEANPLIEKVCLSAFAGNTRALALYRRCGFVEEGRRPRAFKLGSDRYDDEVLMYRFV